MSVDQGTDAIDVDAPRLEISGVPPEVSLGQRVLHPHDPAAVRRGLAPHDLPIDRPTLAPSPANSLAPHEDFEGETKCQVKYGYDDKRFAKASRDMPS